MAEKDRFAADHMYDLIASLKTREECRAFFEDLCTVRELEKMAQRIEAAEQLLAGRTYQEVIRSTEISSATLSRVSRCVQYGSGYRVFLRPEGSAK